MNVIKKILLFVCAFVVTCGFDTITARALSSVEITEVTISNFDYPVGGKTFDQTYSLPNDAIYTKDTTYAEVEWYDSNDNLLDEDAIAVADKEYYAKLHIYIEPGKGYFNVGAVNLYYNNSWRANEIELDYFNSYRFTVIMDFTASALYSDFSIVDLGVDTIDIFGGDTPWTAEDFYDYPKEHYTISQVIWKKNYQTMNASDKFVAGETYTMTIWIDSYSNTTSAQFEGDVMMFLNSSKYGENHQVSPRAYAVTFEFTAKTKINPLDLKGITAPRAYEDMQTSGFICSNKGVDISFGGWEKASGVEFPVPVTGKFQPNTTYILTLYLTAKDGYAFDLTGTSKCNAGTIKNIAYDSDSATVNIQFDIGNAYDLSKCTLTLNQSSFAYTGNYIKPIVKVKYTSGGKTNTLINNKDYKVTYKNFKNPGKATITVIGMGEYYGNKSITFTIRPVDISKSTATLKQTTFTYSGKYIKPVVTVKAKINGKTVTLTNNKDYKVTYKNFKNPGKATITITGKGVCSGTKEITFNIRPSQVKNVKSVSKSKTYVKLKWDSCVGVTGYEVYKSTSKYGTYKKVKALKTTSFKNTGLKSGKTYYYKVRAYKTVGTKKIYGAYSKIYTIKTK